MKGFKVGKKGSFIERVKYDTNEISLLSRGDGIEVLTQSIEKDRLFFVYPSDNKNVFEFFYLLSGEILCETEDEKITLGTQEYFSIKEIDEPIHFKALSDVTMLWVITEPTFVHISEKISSLMEIVKQVEIKDCYTEKHSDRVANYAGKVAKKMKLNKEQLENLIFASYLHDIGKINVPSEILNKPGRLTEEEYEIIKKHPADGAEMVRGTNYDELVPIIEQHHERLNGSGYPFGLKGDEILLEAKIIAVCDTFDAMTGDRSYRKAFDPAYALDVIKSLIGTHYEEEIVDIFEEVLIEEGLISKNLEK
ncbi:phosphohydrolase [Lottiidibacillus patelloidae]|uniref:Phosphohydrolase n=1 Tax=Lottiidibacillus patelloidae TaxID=2670334 RepID=A0A263BTE8_9BACI|nr:HD-GYP domain-containing protein [Lottiidibacillus patelloidae]OZM56657.1 phosphohydrolase [Lottiidibacillus patelloidae]